MEKFSCRYQQLLASCSNITYQKYNENGNTGYIEATDCVNGTWFQNGEMAQVDYETLLVNYERYRSDRSRMVVSSSADQVSLIPWEEDITILNDVRLLFICIFRCDSICISGSVSQSHITFEMVTDGIETDEHSTCRIMVS